MVAVAITVGLMLDPRLLREALQLLLHAYAHARSRLRQGYWQETGAVMPSSLLCLRE